MTSITVSLETAKKLKDAWWSKKCYFIERIRSKTKPKQHLLDEYRLPTAQELLDELPIYIDTKSNEYGQIVLSMEGSATKRCAYYYDIVKEVNYIWPFVWDTLAEAVAQMRLRCKENNFLPTSN